jgi:GPH family glycoside/pentoside/hexuronide:cation symporter
MTDTDGAPLRTTIIPTKDNTMANSTPQVETLKVPLTEKIAYASGDLAFNLVLVLATSYLALFYTDIVKIPAAIVGTIFLVVRLIDAVWTIIVGILMEKIHFKRGKARPWLLYLVIPYGVLGVLVFIAPKSGLDGRIVYAFITYLLSTSILYTAMNIPYGTLNSLMTDDQAERGLINSFRMIGSYIGGIAIAALTLPMVNAMGGGPRAWTLTAGIFAIIGVACLLSVYKFCKERVGSGVQREQQGGEPKARRLARSKSSTA